MDIRAGIPLESFKRMCRRSKNTDRRNAMAYHFSRVQWETEVVDGTYIKKKDAHGKKLPENNWVWSPQGKIAMHKPETWGYLQFSTKNINSNFIKQADEDVKWPFRQVYLREKAYNSEYNLFTDNPSALRLEEVKLNDKAFQPKISLSPTGFTVSYPSVTANGNWYIQTDSKLWFVANN